MFFVYFALRSDLEDIRDFFDTLVLMPLIILFEEIVYVLVLLNTFVTVTLAVD